MSETVAAMSLRPGDVAHISSHACHGTAVNCGDHNIEVTSIRPELGDVVIDYDPWAQWPGDRPASHGSVVYEPLDMVLLLWHGALGATA